MVARRIAISHCQLESDAIVKRQRQAGTHVGGHIGRIWLLSCVAPGRPGTFWRTGKPGRITGTFPLGRGASANRQAAPVLLVRQASSLERHRMEFRFSIRGDRSQRGTGPDHRSGGKTNCPNGYRRKISRVCRRQPRDACDRRHGARPAVEIL